MTTAKDSEMPDVNGKEKENDKKKKNNEETTPEKKQQQPPQTQTTARNIREIQTTTVR